MLETWRFLLTDADSQVERYLQHYETPRQTLTRWQTVKRASHRRPRNKVFIIGMIVSACFFCDVAHWLHGFFAAPIPVGTWCSANAVG